MTSYPVTSYAFKFVNACNKMRLGLWFSDELAEMTSYPVTSYRESTVSVRRFSGCRVHYRGQTGQSRSCLIIRGRLLIDVRLNSFESEL